MVFWIVIGALALIVGGILGITLVRGRVGDKPPAAYDLQVYRDQLKEVDRDEARGVLDAAEAERLRAEVSRRVLAADAQLRAGGDSGGQPRRLGAVIAVVLALGLAGGSVALYAELGAPGYGDVPLQARLAASEEARANRLDQAAAEERIPARGTAPGASAEFIELMKKLRKTVEERPEDLRGLQLLARNEAALGNLPAARKAQERIIAVKGPEASARDYSRLAELMIGAAGGYVSKDAEAALREALEREPSLPTARYYLGLYMLQVDRPDAAFRIWERLLRNSAPDAPWVEPIRAQIEEVAWRAGVDYELPPAPEAPGPSQEDMEAAGEMSAEDRQAMIRGMVEGLSDRLANEGGTADEWARLVNALGVLGETGRARAIWREAQDVFAERPEDLATVRAAAQRAGVAE